MSQPIRLVDCDALLEHLPLVFPGWSIEQLETTRQPPVLSVTRERNIFTMEGDWLDKPIRRRDKVNAICALVAELIRAYVHDQEDLLCLHGAAAEFCGKLVIFPSNYRSGKSVLSACLASSGIPIYCDDVIPISLSEGKGIAPGLAPRLRTPLPDNLGLKARNFIEAHNALEGTHYLYLDLDGTALVPRGRSLPIGAFVLLDREQGSETSFEKISEAEVLQQVVWQNFSRKAEAPRILDVLSRLVTESRLFRLRYDRAEDAVRLLSNEFSYWPTRPAKQGDKTKLANQRNQVDVNLQPGYYLRNADISVLQVDGQSFLADRDGARIHQLNSIGSAIWSLLAEPTTRMEMVDLLCSAYPEQIPARVEVDVGDLLGGLMAKNLLLCGDSPESSVSD